MTFKINRLNKNDLIYILEKVINETTTFFGTIFHFCSWYKNINGGMGNFFHQKLT